MSSNHTPTAVSHKSAPPSITIDKTTDSGLPELLLDGATTDNNPTTASSSNNDNDDDDEDDRERERDKDLEDVITYRGIYLPTLTNRFKEKRLETAYQRYACRQRQKSLVIVNFIDLVVKIVTLTLTLTLSLNNAARRNKPSLQFPEDDGYNGGECSELDSFNRCLPRSSDSNNINNDKDKPFGLNPHVTTIIIWTGISAAANVILGTLAWWKRFGKLRSWGVF